MMLERGLHVDHTTIYRWVQRYAPELEQCCQPHLKATTDSWRVDETYVKVKKVWMYLYRAMDSVGNTLEFLLSPTRDAVAAKQFFQKTLEASHTVSPRVITVDKNAAYPKAFNELKEDDVVLQRCELRQIKYLNNIIEQDHRFIFFATQPSFGEKHAFPTPEQVLTKSVRLRPGIIAGTPRSYMKTSSRRSGHFTVSAHIVQATSSKFWDASSAFVLELCETRVALGGMRRTDRRSVEHSRAAVAWKGQCVGQ